MRKGGNVTLSALADELGSVSVILEWATEKARPLDADVSVLLLGDDGKVRSNDDLIFYNQPSGAGGAVRLRGKTSNTEDPHTAFTDVVDVDMDNVPDSVERVLLAASLDGAQGDGFGRLEYLRVRLLRGSDAAELLRFDVTDASTETAFVLGEVYRRNGQWKFRAIGQGYDTGLETLITEYGVEVDPDDTQGAADGADGANGTAADPAGAAGAAAGSAGAVGAVGATTPAAEVAGAADAPGAAPAGAQQAGGPTVQPRVRERRAQTVTTKKRPAARRLSTSRARRLDETDGEQRWQPARLFPVAGIGGAAEQERRATSAFLAVVGSVREFGRAITTRFGAPAGQVETFIEVPFTRGDEPYVPDGLIRVKRGQRTWTALVEVKTGSGELRAEQIEAYLDIAREQRFDAVITVSNLITAPDERHPVAIDGRKTKKVGVYHLSWAEIRFRCQLLIENSAVADTTQEYILAELLRYLDHARSGALTFDDMGPHWVTVRDSISAGTLRPTDKGLPSVTERFDQLAHYLCLHLGGLLGIEVIPQLNRRIDAGGRRQLLAEELCQKGTLTAVLRIPGTVGPVTVSADLRAARVVCSINVEAPRQGRPLTRVKWVTRQLADANGNLRVESFEQGSREASRAELLTLVRQKPELLVTEPTREIRAFRISLSAPLGPKRGVGKGTFVTSVVDTLEKFYEEVAQNLREWRPSSDPAAGAAAAESGAPAETT
ncbi:putative stress response protein, TerZ- and CABP1 [Frankia sp. EI5c]|nr:putative stress response protein, TerZ- and CABP1 [Frankia sp. EI5c]